MIPAPPLSQLLHTRYPDVESEKAALMRWAAPTLTLGGGGVPRSRIETLLELMYFQVTVPAFWKALVWVVAALSIPIQVLSSAPIIFPSITGTVMVVTVAVLITHSRGVAALLNWWKRRHAPRAAIWLAWLGNAESLPYLTKALQQKPRTIRQRNWQSQAEIALADLLDIMNTQTAQNVSMRSLLRLLFPALTHPRFQFQKDVSETRASLCVAILRFLDRTGNTGLFASAVSDTMKDATDPKSLPNRALVQELACVYHDARGLSASVSSSAIAPRVLQNRL